jgi:hypothetical protein
MPRADMSTKIKTYVEMQGRNCQTQNAFVNFQVQWQLEHARLRFSAELVGSPRRSIVCDDLRVLSAVGNRTRTTKP